MHITDAASKSLMSKGFSTPDPKRSKTDVISSPKSSAGDPPPKSLLSPGNIPLPFSIGGQHSGSIVDKSLEAGLLSSSSGNASSPSGVSQSSLIDTFLSTHGLMLNPLAFNGSSTNSGSSSSGNASMTGGVFSNNVGGVPHKAPVPDSGFVSRAPHG